MEVIPAIDLRDGKCVRLYQGDYERETIYSDDPVEVARRWAGLGATRVHVVDLDGARSGSPENLSTVSEIVTAIDVPVQLGGGVRTVDAARRALEIGVQRVIIGTVAVENPDLVKELCDSFGADRILVGLDAKAGQLMVRGWTEGSGVAVSVLADRLVAAGVVRLIYTDVSRDGTLTEPNFLTIRELCGMREIKLVAAGGIATVAHLVRLARIGVEATIVGKALYTNDIDLAEAIQAVNSTMGGGRGQSS